MQGVFLENVLPFEENIFGTVTVPKIWYIIIRSE